MKLITLAALTTAGMVSTSIAVWMLNKEAHSANEPLQVSSLDANKPRSEQHVVAQPNNPEVPKDQSKFSAGTTLMMEGRLGHAVLAADQFNETFLFVDVKAESSFANASSTPVNLAIVIDHSGSMRGQRLTNALEAARGMVRRLRDGDSVSILSYSDTASVIVPVTTINEISRAQIISQIASMESGGHTCISCGLELAMAMLRQRTGAVNRMLLLSDGEANRGLRHIEELRNLAAQAREMGSSISSIGVDVEYNERIMLALAQESNGRHHFVENPASLAQAFDEEFNSLVQTIAKDALLTVELAEGIEIEEVYDRSFQQFGQRLLIPMGTFAASENKTFLVRVSLPKRVRGEKPVAKIGLSYTDLLRNVAGNCEGQLVAHLTDDLARISQTDPLVLGRVTRSETATALREANSLFASGDASGARRRIQTELANVSEKRDRFAKQAKPAKAKSGGGGFTPVEPDPFAGLTDVLGGADKGFEPASPASREGQVQVRENAEAIDHLAQ